MIKTFKPTSCVCSFCRREFFGKECPDKHLHEKIIKKRELFQGLMNRPSINEAARKLEEVKIAFNAKGT